jgi:hypothetical protein
VFFVDLNSVFGLKETPAVKERLARYDDGRPITEQNLCDWKQGGFLDWQRHQETRAVLREFLSEAEELGEEAGEELLMDDMVIQQKPRDWSGATGQPPLGKLWALSPVETAG